MFTKAMTRNPCKALIDGISTYMFGEDTPDYESAVNSMYINGTVLAPAGHPKTQKIIEDLGYPVVRMNTGKCRPIDGSLTCLSLRF